jgi:hypothetical protein
MTTYILPTVLYIKQHSITGLKYFGKTTKDPLKYNGSGKHWLRHIKKHGRKHIITTWVSEPYIDSDAIVEFALAFSKDNNIVESDLWANIIPENGLDGGPSGPSGPRGKQQNPHGPYGPYGPRGKQQNPSGPRGKQQNPSGPRGPNGKKGMPSGRKGILKGPQKLIECPHCGKIGGNNMKRYHFDNCKIKPDTNTFSIG